MEIYGLEYNEKQHWFHRTDKYDNYSPAKASGWITIFKRIREDQLIKFFDMVDILYPRLDKKLLTLKQVKRLKSVFNKFVK